jgi:hypothetical protein
LKNWHVLINWWCHWSPQNGRQHTFLSILNWQYLSNQWTDFKNLFSSVLSFKMSLQWKLIPTFRTTSLTWMLTAVGTTELSTVDAYLYIEQKSDAYSQYLLPIFIKCSSSWVSRSGQTWRWWALEDSKQHNLMLMHLLFSVKLYSVYIVLFYFYFFVKTIFSETSTENRETLFVFKLTILSKNKKYLLFYL